jgi:predicted dipeptidase
MDAYAWRGAAILTITRERLAAPVLILTVVAAAHVARAETAAQTPAAAAHRYFDRHDQARLVPLLQEVLRFPTVAGNDAATRDQQQWLLRTARSLGFTVRDAGPVTEVDLPGPEGAPVLGLIIHGDVQPVDEKAWSVAPFRGLVKGGAVWGRGSADDKAPLVQALLAMHALRESGLARTHTIRLLAGSDEESGNLDIGTYLKSHAPPTYSLVLDALFPVVIGEKAWNALRLSVDPKDDVPTPDSPWDAVGLEAGLSASIVPDRARLILHWRNGDPDWSALEKRVHEREPRPDTHLTMTTSGRDLVLEMKGHAAHNGMNVEGGRNALVSLAHVVGDVLPPSGIRDLLRFTDDRTSDSRGSGLGLPAPDPLWRGYDVTAALVGKLDDRLALTINIRRPPPWNGEDLRKHLTAVVEKYNREQGSHLRMDPSFFFGDEWFAVDGDSPLVRRLLGAYRRATGEAEAGPVVIGGGTYSKRVPQAVTFGMWFPERPYPGHDVDEHVPTRDLIRGTHVLIETLVDIGTGAPLGAAPLRLLSAPAVPSP